MGGGWEGQLSALESRRMVPTASSLPLMSLSLSRLLSLFYLFFSVGLNLIFITPPSPTHPRPHPLTLSLTRPCLLLIFPPLPPPLSPPSTTPPSLKVPYFRSPLRQKTSVIWGIHVSYHLFFLIIAFFLSLLCVCSLPALVFLFTRDLYETSSKPASDCLVRNGLK